MNEPTLYRLGEYLIAEYDRVLYTWERHAALAEQRSGRCYHHGDMLIIGDCRKQESGYLIGEFIERLQKLPEWNKTRFYCFASSLLQADTGHRLTDDFIEQRLSEGDISKIQLKPGVFRLGQYRMAVKDNADIFWQMPDAFGRIAGGRGMIESALLLIGAQELTEEGQTKQNFLAALAELPKWDKTPAWGPVSALLPCLQEAQRENSNSAIRPAGHAGRLKNVVRAAPRQMRYKESAARMISSVAVFPKMSWQHLRKIIPWKKFLIPMFILGLLFAAVILLFIQDKESHHHAKEHHHELHDD